MVTNEVIAVTGNLVSVCINKPVGVIDYSLGIEPLGGNFLALPVCHNVYSALFNVIFSVEEAEVCEAVVSKLKNGFLSDNYPAAVIVNVCGIELASVGGVCCVL